MDLSFKPKEKQSEAKRSIDNATVSFIEQRRKQYIFSLQAFLRVTLDEGPRSRDQWIQAVLLVESFKLVPRPLDEGPRPKSGKLRLHGTCFGGEINWFGPNNSAKRRAPDLENQESG